jgi:hypothetical protein
MDELVEKHISIHRPDMPCRMDWIVRTEVVDHICGLLSMEGVTTINVIRIISGPTRSVVFP